MTDAPDAVARRRREWETVVEAGDLHGYGELVTHDVVWLPPAGEPVVGRDAFRAWLAPHFERYDYDFTVEPVHTRPVDGWCGEVGRFRSHLSRGDGSEPMEHAGTYFVLWRLDDDGEWRIERYVDGIGA